MAASDFFEKIVAPAALNNKLVPRYRNLFLESIYMDYQEGQVGHLGMPTVINVPVVNEDDVTDIGNGAVSVSDKANRKVELIIDRKLSVTKKIESLDSIRSAVQLKDQYMQGMLESLLRKCNGTVAAQFTSTNLDAYAVVNGFSATAFNRENVADLWANVVGTGGAPETDGDLFFITDQATFGKMVGNKANDWITEAVVGVDAATQAQQKAQLAPAFNARIDYDQKMKSTTANRHGGVFFHRMAVGMLPLPEAKPAATFIDHMVIYPTRDKRFPVMVQFWYDAKEQAHLLHLYSIFGLKIVQKEWAGFAETIAAV